MSKYPLKLGKCKECKNDIFAQNAGHNPVKRGRKFCSKKCQIIWQNKNIPITDKRRKILSDRGKNLGTDHMRTPSAINNLRNSIMGSKHWNWQGGKTKESIKIRNSLEMKLWRKSVFERDNYKCVLCESGGILNADHIKQFAYYPELRFDINNGRTLCIGCHKKTDTFANKKPRENVR